MNKIIVVISQAQRKYAQEREFLKKCNYNYKTDNDLLKNWFFAITDGKQFLINTTVSSTGNDVDFNFILINQVLISKDIVDKEILSIIERIKSKKKQIIVYYHASKADVSGERQLNEEKIYSLFGSAAIVRSFHHAAGHEICTFMNETINATDNSEYLRKIEEFVESQIQTKNKLRAETLTPLVALDLLKQANISADSISGLKEIVSELRANVEAKKAMFDELSGGTRLYGDIISIIEKITYNNVGVPDIKHDELSRIASEFSNIISDDAII